jgi:steroid delta-isomerase-like uncharacterized protein
MNAAARRAVSIHNGPRQSAHRTKGRVARSLARDYGCSMAVSASAPDAALELRGFMERYEATWNGCDTDAMADLITEDIVWADPALPEPARGIPAVQEFMRTSFRAFPDLQFGQPDPPALAVTGDVVLWAWYMEGTHRGAINPPGFAPTGRAMRVDGVDQWTMRDGRIARYRAFYDMNDVARQLGIVPAPGSRAERGMVALQRLRARLSR